MYLRKSTDIESIEFKYPELFGSDKEQIVRDLISDIESSQEELQSLRSLVLNKEKSLKELEDKYKTISPMFDIKYKEQPKTEWKPTKCNLQIINPTDYRNRHD